MRPSAHLNSETDCLDDMHGVHDLLQHNFFPAVSFISHLFSSSAILPQNATVLTCVAYPKSDCEIAVHMEDDLF